MNTKICKTCKRELDLISFRKNSRCVDGLNPNCKDCLKKRDEEGRKRRGDNRAAYSKYKAFKAREWSYNYLLTHPCVDCGEKRIATLQYDHIDPSDKKMGIATMVSKGHRVEEIEKEVEKCEVRCANCHAVRTAQQNNWYAWRDNPIPSPYKQKKEKDCGDWLKYKEGCRCDLCRKANSIYQKEYLNRKTKQ